MKINIDALRAAGVSDKQILDALRDGEVKRREQNRKAQQNHRSRQQKVADRADMESFLDLSSDSQEKTLRTRARARADGYSPEFEAFWRAYPARAGSNPKYPASQKFEAHCARGVDPQVMIRAAEAYAADELQREKVGTVYIAQAVTWLNQRRFEVETVAPLTAEQLKAELFAAMPWNQPQGGANAKAETEVRRGTGVGAARPVERPQLRLAGGTSHGGGDEEGRQRDNVSLFAAAQKQVPR